MREILFRGKNEADVWHYGAYLPYESGEAAILESFSEYGCEAVELSQRCKVIPETVGQYTGLTDKNGKKIFEGDIVREYGGEFAQGFYEIDRKLIVEIPNTLANLILGNDCGCKYKIIGNIHDNPEMMEGGAE